MGCCGDKRRRVRGPTPRGGPGPATTRAPAATSGRYSQPYFQYVGSTGLTVIGPISKLRYRFDRRGAILGVDARDRPALAGVPNLREVRPP